jgi:Carboxypeptidase regulatory-like domain
VNAVLLAAVLVLGQGASPLTYGRVVGQVVEQGQNTPIAGARINMLPAGRPATLPPPMYETTTDAEGRFALEYVPPGEYRLQASKAGYAMPTLDVPPPTVDVSTGQTPANVSIALVLGGAIAGRVLDASGEPQTEVQVMAVRRLQNGPPMPVPIGRNAQTDDLGMYRLYGLPPGQYYVEVSPRPQFGLFNVTSARATVTIPTYYPAARTADTAQAIAVTAGETIKDVDIRVIETAAYQISGTVIGESGAPVAGAAVSVEPDRNPASGMPIMFGPPSNVRTNADGTFAVPNLAPGTYHVSAGVPITRVPDGAGGIGAVSTSGAGFTNFTSWSVNPNGISFSGGDFRQLITITNANVEGVRLTLTQTPR